ncbi:MAG: alanine--glyoxylate aminotransferase family protein, partial [Synergistales bacterium]|nr:alanine--glyoxylate aminotransferase family protein [Synergistales bacterium]
MKYLFTPGPVPLPHEVASSGARPMIGHRSEEFSALLLRLQNRLRDLLKSSGPVVLFPSSGTGALQSLVENLLRPGDVVISVSCGQFGFRFREMASRMDCQIIPVDVPWGGAVAPEAVVEAVKAHPEARAILLTHNETSTGVINPIHAIASALPKERPLLLVDVVSSLGVAPC